MRVQASTRYKGLGFRIRSVGSGKVGSPGLEAQGLTSPVLAAFHQSYLRSGFKLWAVSAGLGVSAPWDIRAVNQALSNLVFKVFRPNIGSLGLRLKDMRGLEAHKTSLPALLPLAVSEF